MKETKEISDDILRDMGLKRSKSSIFLLSLGIIVVALVITGGILYISNGINESISLIGSSVF